MWKESLKNLLYRVAPQFTTEFMSARARAYSQKIIASWGCGEVNRLLVEHFGMTVLSGPMAGLKLTESAKQEQLGPYLLGIYESELDAVWDELLGHSYTQIVDIGAKFGYYAVGLARRYTEAQVVAFDTDWWARRAISELARANQTTNVDVRGYCSAEWLASGVKPGALVISDCEGFEAALFTDKTIRCLTNVTLIVETHDCYVPGVSDRLEKLFSQSHRCRRVGLTEVRRPSPVNLDFLTADQRKLAEHEVRDRQVWLVCTPR